jgi:hypothetical protein
LSSERQNNVPLQVFKSNSDPTAAETWDLKGHMLKVKQGNSAKQEMNNY